LHQRHRPVDVLPSPTGHPSRIRSSSAFHGRASCSVTYATVRPGRPCRTRPSVTMYCSRHQPGAATTRRAGTREARTGTANDHMT